MGGVGWECAKCTYWHTAPGQRCVMCDALRVGKEEMRDFVLGKTLKMNKGEGESAAEEALQTSSAGVAKENQPHAAAAAASGFSANSGSSMNTTKQRPTAGPAAAPAPVFRNPYANPYAKKPVSSAPATALARPSPSSLPRHQSAAAGGQASNPTAWPSTGSTTTYSSTSVIASGHLPMHPSAAANTLQRPMSQHSFAKPPPSARHYIQPPPPSAGRSVAATPQQQQQRPSSSSSKPDIWSRSIRPSPIPYEPGPVPLDPMTRRDWIYPIHQKFPIRDYQLEISTTAIMHNTLVSLPTGLGKTLIAAVVLYNYYRWFPTGKVLFLAPTLPLVHQQVKACYDIMGIPAEDTAILTGKVGGKEREQLWQERRVFFCTPQTVQRDIDANRCPASLVVCVVLDEAHKACGAYAYVQVMEQLEHAKAKFRVLGLSATPGSEIKAIQKVITALRISRIEVRLDDDPGVKKHIHERHSEIIVVKTGSVVTKIERLLSNLIAPVLERLRQENALSHIRGNATLTPYCLIRAREAYVQRSGGDNQLNAFFLTAQKLVDVRCHLRRTGIGMVRSKMLTIQNEPRGLLKSVVRSNEFREVMDAILLASSDGHVNETAEDRMLNNPKLMKLDEILKEHFERSRACGESSRAIVFSQWRESVSEIVQVLSSGQPLLRPRHFVGQGKSSGGSKNKQNSTVDQNCVSLKGMKQSEQQQVIREFQNGSFNILVCTCIGEEGLDIGEVDLIVNYDTLRSPIRMIQRVGRTGRKRDGRVVCLVSEGQEEKTMQASKAAEKTLGRALKNPTSFQFTRSIPMFEETPELRKTDMSVSASFHMSQVGGNGNPFRGRDDAIESVRVKRESLENPDAWRLSDVQEQQRRAMFGDLEYANCSELRSHDGRFPSALKTRFLRARSRALSCPSRDEKHDTFGFGATRKILATLEKHHGKEAKRGRRRLAGRSLRDSDVLGRLFPFDPLPASKRMGPCTITSLAPASRKVVQGDENRPSTDSTPQGGMSDANTVDSMPGSASPSHLTHAEPEAQDREMESTLPLMAGPTESGGDMEGRPHGQTEVNFRPRESTDSSVAPMEADENLASDMGPIEEFILPTPADSSSDESDSEDEDKGPAELEHEDREGQEGSTTAVAPSDTAEHFEEAEPSADSDDEEEDIPLQDLRLPTQESSSDEDEDNIEDEVERTDVVDRDASLDLIDTPSTQPSEHPEEETPKVKTKAHSIQPRNVFISQATPASLASGPPLIAPTPAPASHGDVLVDTPPDGIDADAPEDDIRDVVCAVCCSGDSTENDPIVLCDGPNNDMTCPLAVHKSCYPISYCINELENWWCDVCEAKNMSLDTSAQCQVCRKTDGPLKRMNDRGGTSWVHSYCSPWRSDKSSRICQYCAAPGAIGCSAKGCSEFAHPHCALTLQEHHWSALELGGHSLLFCNEHVPKIRSILQEAGIRHFSAKNLPRFISHKDIFPADEEYQVQEQPRRKRLQKKSSLVQQDADTKPSPVMQDDDDDELADTEESDDSDSERSLKRQRVQERIKRRRLASRFIANEAECDTDEDVDGDLEDDEALRRIEEEEEFHNSFINDSSQLGAATQDESDHVDETVAVHRAFDNEKERVHQFATPRFNRRMMKHGRNQNHHTPGSHQAWDEPTPASSSQKGLGNMHFVRSVLEHHRQGGDAEEIEQFYHELAEGYQSSEEESRAQGPLRETSVMEDLGCDSEDESEDE